MSDKMKVEIIESLLKEHEGNPDKFYMLRGMSFNDRDILNLIYFALCRRKNNEEFPEAVNG